MVLYFRITWAIYFEIDIAYFVYFFFFNLFGLDAKQPSSQNLNLQNMQFCLKFMHDLNFDKNLLQ